MKPITIAVSMALLCSPALAQKVDQERHQAEMRRLEAEVEPQDQQLRDQASVIEAELWSRVMAEDSARTERETKEIIRQMDESRKEREAERLRRWQANPYRYEMRMECPPQPTSILGGLAAAFKPSQPCVRYFVRILVNLEGQDVGTPPERIPGYPPSNP